MGARRSQNLTKRCGRARAACRIDIQPELYCRADRVRDAFGAQIGDRTRHHATNKRNGVLALSKREWRVAVKQCEDGGRQTVNVRGYRGGATLEQLRRGVGRGSDQDVRGRLAATRDARNAEVAELRFPVSSEQDVGGLDITMKNTRAVSGFQSARQSHPYRQRLIDCERSMTLDPGAQRIPTVVGHHDVWTSGEGLAAMQHGHDVRVARDPSHRPLLAVKVFEIDVVLIGTEHLDRDDSVE